MSFTRIANQLNADKVPTSRYMGQQNGQENPRQGG